MKKEYWLAIAAIVGVAALYVYKTYGGGNSSTAAGAGTSGDLSGDNGAASGSGNPSSTGVGAGGQQPDETVSPSSVSGTGQNANSVGPNGSNAVGPYPTIGQNNFAGNVSLFNQAIGANVISVSKDQYGNLTAQPAEGMNAAQTEAAKNIIFQIARNSNVNSGAVLGDANVNAVSLPAKTLQSFISPVLAAAAVAAPKINPASSVKAAVAVSAPATVKSYASSVLSLSMLSLR